MKIRILGNLLCLGLFLAAEGYGDDIHKLTEGEDLYQRECYEEALAVFEAAANCARENHNDELLARALLGTGKTLLGLTRYFKAEEILENAESQYIKNGDKEGQARCLELLGRTAFKTARYRKALHFFQRALEIDQLAGNYGKIAYDLILLANAHLLLDDFSRAEESYIEAMDLSKANGFSKQLAHSYLGLGIIYTDLGAFEKAKEYLYNSLEDYKEIEYPLGVAKAYLNLGQFYTKLAGVRQEPSLYDQALQYCLRSLDLRRDIDDRIGEGITLYTLSRIYSLQGKNDLAKETALGELRIMEQIPSYHEIAIANMRLGEIALDLGNHKEAFEYYNKAEGMAKEMGRQSLLWRIYFKQGESLRTKGDIGAALDRYYSAVDVLEDIRSRLMLKEQKIGYMEDKLHVYDEILELLKTLHEKEPSKGYDRKSLEIFERKQGRTFLEEMGKSGARHFAGLPEKLLAQEVDLEIQRFEIQSALVDERSKPVKDKESKLIQALEERSREVKENLKDLEEKIKTSAPDYYTLKYPQPATLPELQGEALKPGEVMLVYAVMEDMTCLWVVGKEHFGLYSLNCGEKDLIEKVADFRAKNEAVVAAIRGETPNLTQTLKKTRDEIERQGHELYELLLPKEVRPLIGKARLLYIVPTGPLYGLPFEALVMEPSGGSRTPHYLVENHSFSYLSSASLLKILRDASARRKTSPSYPLLVFAHPVYSKGSHASGEEGTIKGMRTKAYLSILGGEFEELPETEQEAKEIKDILEAPEESEPLQLREKASRSTIFRFNNMNRLDDYRFIVFACHGILPGEVNKITQPALVLSHPEREGYLTMADVFGIEMNAELVTLSACNTGRGKIAKGEGVMGLTRAFMYAGTSTVMVSLWPVETLSSRILTTGHYRKISAGSSKAEALRNIKLSMIKGEQGALFRHPFFWSPFVIFGDGQ